MEFPNRGFDRRVNDKPGGARVNYIDSSSLKRPFNMPLAVTGIGVVFVLIAGVIGFVFWDKIYGAIILAPQQELESTQQNLSKEVPLELPVLVNMVHLDANAVVNTFNEAAYSFYDLNKLSGAEVPGLDVIKLPEGVGATDAALAYGTGLGTISGAEAVRILNGSWRFTVGASNFTEMRLRYADFHSGSLENAIKYGIDAQGWTDAEFGESGTDSAGNTYQEGTIVVNGATYGWRVSVCPLEDVYSITGVPDTAVYVGLRLFLGN